MPSVIYAFSPLLLAQGVLMAGMMANRIFYAGATLPEFKVELIGLVAVMVFAVLGPLLVFSLKLEAAKRAGLREYGTLAQRYVREYDDKWLRGGAPPDEPLVGSADIQSLADLGNSFEVVKEMRLAPFTLATVLQLAVTTLLPVLPLMLTMISLEELLERAAQDRVLTPPLPRRPVLFVQITPRNLSLVPVVLALCACASSAAAQDLQRGTIVDPVQCAGDPAQTYALYLPSTYSPERTWSLLLAFHPAARGRLMAEKYRAAAEQYGYIVAASNNARNGPHAISAAAAQAMGTDVSRRFAIDPQRIYLTGMSGGARVALGMALANPGIAGVVASSAGYPDSQPRDKVAFAIFGTAGTEDFNHLEMRLLDRKLTSPHFLAVFEGGHTLPPDDIALDALEWMELQAMQSGRRRRDDALVGRILEKRRSGIAASSSVTDTVYLLRALVSDFKGLADVSAEAGRLEELSRQSDVKKALEARTRRRRCRRAAAAGDLRARGAARRREPPEPRAHDASRSALDAVAQGRRRGRLAPSAARPGAWCGRLLLGHRRGCRTGSISRCWTSIVRSGGDPEIRQEGHVRMGGRSTIWV